VKVSSFIDELGDMLQEDFSVAALWTKNELLGYLRFTLEEFAVRTRIIDKQSIKTVNATSGELDVPLDFLVAYYVKFNQRHVDLVELGELDFISASWAIGTTGATPKGASVFGTGDNAVIRMVPVPSVVSSNAPGVSTSLVMSDSTGSVWAITVNTGEMVATASSGTTTAPVLEGPSTFWNLTIDTVGELDTSASAASVTSSDLINLTDTDGSNIVWRPGTNDLGEIVTTNRSYGLIIQASLGGTTQAFSAGDNSGNVDYGVVVDGYAAGVSTTPSDVLRLDGPVGVSLYDRTADNSADLWYKGRVSDVTSLQGEIFLGSSFLGILKHGVLSMAFSHEGDGKDADKAKLFRQIFISECAAVEQLFGAQR